MVGNCCWLFCNWIFDKHDFQLVCRILHSDFVVRLESGGRSMTFFFLPRLEFHVNLNWFQLNSFCRAKSKRKILKAPVVPLVASYFLKKFIYKFTGFCRRFARGILCTGTPHPWDANPWKQTHGVDLKVCHRSGCKDGPSVWKCDGAASDRCIPWVACGGCCSQAMMYSFRIGTPRKTKIEPEDHPFEKEHHCLKPFIPGFHVSVPGV